MMKFEILRTAILSALLLASAPATVEAQAPPEPPSDEELVRRYADLWADVATTIRSESRCELIAAALAEWHDEHSASLDTLYGYSQGLSARLRGESLRIVEEGQQPLIQALFGVAGRCGGTPEYREASAFLDRLMAMGG